MKERPIIFSGSMVLALLAGTKTQTRRIVKPQPRVTSEEADVLSAAWADGFIDIRCPFGQPGDRLWMRETWCDDWEKSRGIVYRADGGLDADMSDAGCTWRPSIHMPRRASRITLEIGGVRVQRLQDISRGDAMDEGCPFQNLNVDAARTDPVGWFRNLWESLHGASAWDANPWVWALEFKRHSAE